MGTETWLSLHWHSQFFYCRTAETQWLNPPEGQCHSGCGRCRIWPHPQLNSQRCQSRENQYPVFSLHAGVLISLSRSAVNGVFRHWHNYKLSSSSSSSSSSSLSDIMIIDHRSSSGLAKLTDLVKTYYVLNERRKLVIRHRYMLTSLGLRMTELFYAVSL